MQIDLEAIPKQMELLVDEQSKQLLYSGAWGSGKSRGLCMKLVKRASVPGAFEGLTRSGLKDLKATTLRTLLEPEADLPPVLPEGSYTHNKNESLIRIKGGGSIYYFGCDQSRSNYKVGSLNLSGCAVDEATELDESEWMWIMGRLRRNVRGLSRQLYGACNPSTPSHHLAMRFGLSPEKQEPDPGCHAIRTKTIDNPYLPEDYVESLLNLTGVARMRYVEGEWVGSEGLIYDNWLRATHVIEREGLTRFIIAVDEGFTNPFAAGRLEIDEDNRTHLAAEVYASRMSYPEKVQAVLDLGGLDAEAVVVDPSAAGLVNELRIAGIHVVEANNDVLSGIGCLHARLQVAGDGRPRHTVDPSCRNAIREFESYEWNDKADKDRPIKQMDHTMDMQRYGVMHLDEGAPASVSMVTRDYGKRVPEPGEDPYAARDDEQERFRKARAERLRAFMEGVS